MTSSGGKPTASKIRQHDDALRARSPIGHPEHRGAAVSDARNVSDRVLNLVRIDVLAATDDDVFDASGDENTALRNVGPIAAGEPPIVEQLARLGLVSEVAGRC